MSSTHRGSIRSAAACLLLVTGAAVVPAAGADKIRPAPRPWSRTARAAGVAATPPIGKGTILRFVEVFSDDLALVDVDQNGAADAGDYFLLRDPLLNEKDGTPAGTLHLTCTFGFAESFNCQGTIDLGATGTLSLAGVHVEAGEADDSGFLELAVTGGTGSYRRAHGQVYVPEGEGGEPFILTIDLADGLL